MRTELIFLSFLQNLCYALGFQHSRWDLANVNECHYGKSYLINIINCQLLKVQVGMTSTKISFEIHLYTFNIDPDILVFKISFYCFPFILLFLKICLLLFLFCFMALNEAINYTIVCLYFALQKQSETSRTNTVVCCHYCLLRNHQGYYFRLNIKLNMTVTVKH